MTANEVPSPPRQSLAVNVALSLLTVAMFLVVAEGVARLAEGSRPRPAAPRREPLWGTGADAGYYIMKSASAGWPPWEPFNRDGMRDRLHTVEKPPGVRRVVCLGDSVTLGPDNHPEQAYPQVLQDRLDALGPSVEVFNVALWGWATPQERIAYERVARKYSPDQVILGLCLNDIEDLQNQLAQPPALLLGLHERSALVRRLVNAEGRQIREVDELFRAKDSPRVREGFERLFGEIRRLAGEVRKDGVDFALLVFPYRAQVGPDPPAPSVQERIAAFCATEHIRLLDVLPGLRPLGEAAFLEGDGFHLSPIGCARVADEVLAAHLIPDEAARAGAPSEALPVLQSPSARLRAEAAWSLGGQGSAARAAVPALARLLTDPEERVRLAAAEALGRLASTAAGAAPALGQSLMDPRPSVRWSAARALWRIGPRTPEALRALSTALDHGDFYVRAFAAWSLGEVGPAAAAAIPTLATHARDPDEGVRSLALKALARVGAGDGAAVVALCEALREPNWDDRRKAARALGKMGPGAAAAVTSLVAALSDPNPYVRRESAEALARIGDRSVTALHALARAEVDPAADVRASATEAVAKLSASAR